MKRRRIGIGFGGVMEKQQVLAIAFFVLFGAVLAFVIGQRVGSSLDRHGRNVTIAHEHTSPPPAPPVAQK
ncbi:MAG TPA: hypothetical protein VGH87_15560 [Polyangiaceae bacterium]|nr:hypothetical protein [Polyangiaceae bacterium]